MTETSLAIALLSCAIVLIFAIENHQQELQYANGITNSTSTSCINGKCVTTMCIDNEPCRTITSNSTTTIPDDLTQNNDNNTDPIPAPLRTA
jgi:hypothetical protein